MSAVPDIALNNGLEGSPLKSAIESRLLARDDWDRIARRARMKTQMLEAYEAVFFNVRPELDNEDYVLHQVMGPALHLGIHEQEYDFIWKMIGFKGGPAAQLANDVPIDLGHDHGRADRAAPLADDRSDPERPTQLDRHGQNPRFACPHHKGPFATLHCTGV